MNLDDERLQDAPAGLDHPRDAAYGQALGRCFGLPDAPALSVELAGRGVFAVTRITCDGVHAGLMPEIPAQDAYLATLHLGSVRHQETWHAGRPVLARDYAPGMVQILDLREEIATYVAGPWDALGFYVPRTLVRAVARSTGALQVQALECEAGKLDPVLGNLGAAMTALLSHGRPPSHLMMRRLAMATSIHLVQTYGMRGADSGRGHRARTMRRWH